jgi:CubicO group peptidase (beta-lactamase class C family)
VPGIAIGIIHDGIVEMAGIGITNVENPQPVTEGTQFYIGSATKPFTASVVLKMVDRGEVDLNASARRYLPNFLVDDIDASRKARVIDLFQHRTGWKGDYFDDPSTGEDALEKALLAFRFLPQRTPYGEVWAYNNVNYIIAGRLI